VFALRVEFLLGRMTSQSVHDRDEPEWPPHPVRLFYALVATHFETGAEPAEVRFLEWLEAQGPALLVASDGTRRVTVTHYVPVNDVRLQDGVGNLPDRRPRQPRTFPAFVPQDPVVYFVWPDADPPTDVRLAAATLCGKVSCLGHSSSLVGVAPVSAVPPATWEPSPDEQAEVVLRVPFPGLLAALRAAHQRFLASGVRGALPAAAQAYRRARRTPRVAKACSVFGTMVAFRRSEGPRLPATAAPMVARAMRRAILALAGEPIPEVLSGHQPDGSPSVRPHVAYLGLPDVGHRYADGHLLGVAALLPRDLSAEDRQKVLAALGRLQSLALGRLGLWRLVRLQGLPAAQGLWPETWCGPSRWWHSVTPVLLDRFPDTLWGPEARACVAEACRRIGLPAPSVVQTSPYAVPRGAPPAFAFAPARGARERRPLVHASLAFSAPVEGPLLLGAGRFWGWGLFRPAPDEGGGDYAGLDI
jgi:CRISPR-associated protein Csb2